MFAPKLLGFEFLTVILRCSASKGYVHSKARRLWLWKMSGPRCVWWPQLLHCVSLWYAVSWAGGWIMSLPNTVFVWAQTPRLQNMLIFGNLFFFLKKYLLICICVWVSDERMWAREKHSTTRGGRHSPSTVSLRQGLCLCCCTASWNIKPTLLSSFTSHLSRGMLGPQEHTSASRTPGIGQRYILVILMLWESTPRSQVYRSSTFTCWVIFLAPGLLSEPWSHHVAKASLELTTFLPKLAEITGMCMQWVQQCS